MALWVRKVDAEMPLTKRINSAKADSTTERQTQVEDIARCKEEDRETRQPVTSIDTNKKEELGTYMRDGVSDRQKTILVNDHDISSKGQGTLIPHGIYDLRKNQGYLHLN